jgi:hypothetical protein
MNKPIVLEPVTGLIEVAFSGFTFSPELVSPAHPKLYMVQCLTEAGLKRLHKEFNAWGASEGRGPMEKGELFLGLLNHLVDYVEAANCGDIKIQVRHFLGGFNLPPRQLHYINQILAQCQLFL